MGWAVTGTDGDLLESQTSLGQVEFPMVTAACYISPFCTKLCLAQPPTLSPMAQCNMIHDLFRHLQVLSRYHLTFVVFQKVEHGPSWQFHFAFHEVMWLDGEEARRRARRVE